MSGLELDGWVEVPLERYRQAYAAGQPVRWEDGRTYVQAPKPERPPARPEPCNRCSGPMLLDQDPVDHEPEYRCLNCGHVRYSERDQAIAAAHEYERDEALPPGRYRRGRPRARGVRL